MRNTVARKWVDQQDADSDYLLVNSSKTTRLATAKIEAATASLFGSVADRCKYLLRIDLTFNLSTCQRARSLG